MLQKFATTIVLIHKDLLGKSVSTADWYANHIVIGEQSYLYQSLQFEVGGTQNSLLFISHNNQKIGYVTIDRDLKKNLKAHDLYESVFKPTLRKHKKTSSLDLTIFAIIVLMISGLIFFRSEISTGLTNAIPFSFEKKIADQIFETTQKKQFEKQSEAEKNLQKLVFQIQELQSKDYTVHLSASKEPNAYATLGGHIFINVGLLQILKTPEELLGVVGHELIHSKNRHVVRGIFQGAGLFLFIQALLGDISGVAAVLIDGGVPLLNLSYSRDLESEADRESVEILFRNQIDPSGLDSALTQIEIEIQKMMNEVPAGDLLEKIQNQNFLRSHPQTADRKKLIQEQILKLRETQEFQNIKFKDLTAEWNALQKSLKDL